MVIATLNLLDEASDERSCHLIRQALPDTFPVQGKVFCVVIFCRVRSIDYIGYDLINCRSNLLQTFPSGGRGTALAVDEVSRLTQIKCQRTNCVGTGVLDGPYT